MFSSILSSSKSWIVWMVLGLICLGVIVFIYLAKKHAKKSNDQQEKAWAENVRRNQILQKQIEDEQKATLIKQEEQKKKAYRDQLDKVLESIFNYKTDNIVKLCHSKRCTSAVENFFKSSAINQFYDLDFFVMPKKYFINSVDSDGDNSSILTMYSEMMSFISCKSSQLHKEIKMDDYYKDDTFDVNSFNNSELKIKIDVYDYFTSIMLDNMIASINSKRFISKMKEYDLRNSSNGIESINALYLGLNGLGIIKNFTLEDFYTFVALKQYKMNNYKLFNFYDKYDIDYEKIGDDISAFILQLSDMDEDCIGNYFISHPNNVLFDIIKCVTDKNGGDDLADLLILIISHHSQLNYRESIDVSKAILNIYDNAEKAKVKAANYINGISKSDDSVSIYDVDAMSGVEFEEFVGKLFEKLGYTTEITKASADQGVDLIAKKTENCLQYRQNVIVELSAIMQLWKLSQV